MDTSQAVVAVITTCYDQGHLIGDTIQSVIDQKTDATVYHVICDDGSTDNSVAVLRHWEALHDHITVVECTNRNCAGAFNAALLNVPADAEYIVLIGGDDWLADNFIEETLLALGDADMVVPAMQRVEYPDHDNRVAQMPKVQHPTVDQLWEWETTYAWAVALFRKSALLAAGGFHQATEGDCDWDMWIDLAKRGYTFAYTDKTRFFYRYVETSMNRLKTAHVWDDHRREMRRHHRMTTLPGPEFS